MCLAVGSSNPFPAVALVPRRTRRADDVLRVGRNAARWLNLERVAAACGDLESEYKDRSPHVIAELEYKDRSPHVIAELGMPPSNEKRKGKDGVDVDVGKYARA